MENFKQKVIAIIILIIVVVGLVLLTMFLRNKNIDTETGEKTGISLFTKKNPGNKQVKNQGGVGNQNTTDFTGNDTTKPVSIIENVINTITGKDNNASDGNNGGSSDTNVPVNQGGIGQAIRNFFLGDDGLPTGTSGTTGSTGQGLGSGSLLDTGNNTKTIPTIDVPIDVVNLTGDDLPRAECSPAVYVSKLTRKQDLELQIKLGIKKLETLTDEEQELQKWKPTKLEQDEDDMKRALHRYWDIWSYPDNYLKPEGDECGTWSDTTSSESDFFKKPVDQIVVNQNTINNAKREVRKSFSALSTITSSVFSVSQSEGQRVIAENDNIRYDEMINDCRVIRGQFEGGYTYAPDGKTRINIGQYYYPNAQSGTAFIADSHKKIAEDLARRVKLAPKLNTELGRLIEKARKAKMGIGPELTDAEIVRYQELMLAQRFNGQEELGGLIRSEIIKSKLINWSDDTNILTATEMGNISYLWDNNNPPQTGDFWIPKNKAENMTTFNGDLAKNVTQSTLTSKDIEARYYLTKWPKIQYGGDNGTRQLRGSTFWSSSQSAVNFNPGLYVIREPQNIWELLGQDKEKVLFCRLNKFMGQWAGIETNSHPAQYVVSHGINCDNATFSTKEILEKAMKDIAGSAQRNDSVKGGFVYIYKGYPTPLSEILSKPVGPAFYNLFESETVMTQFFGIERDNWYSNSPQNAIFEFIKDED